ncbi:restriction endonuclease subunit S [Acinetobacter nosocomialis]|uniref:restriction endonuclease subunit S n=1 Tax=Acinetobacter calcoaceticus/baumannii complex TaxID=909768 RepID=UPI0022704FD6|nr:restriction endonuclease subunit S [Acinetobacter pittii]
MISRNSLGNIYPIKKLGDVADFLDSRRKPVKECDRIIGPYPYYGANGLQGWINDFLFDENLILLAEDGGHFDNPDRGVAYKISGKTWVNNHAHVIKPKEGVDLDYLCRVLENYDLTPWITGTTRGKLTKGGASEILIPLPPLSEQRRIASILDQADELRQKRQQAIEKLDQLLQATFIDMFGDPASNPKGWNLGKLGDVIHSAKDGPHVSPNYSETGIPFLSTRHVRAGKIVWDDLKFITEEDAQIHWKKCKPTRGDILYTKGGTTGLAAVVDTDLDFAVWVHVALLKTNHDKVRSEWLVSMLNTQYCYEQSQRYTHGIANRDLGLKRMVNIEMYIPSLDEQDKFVNFKNKLMKNNLLFENSNSYFEQLFKSLQNQAFNGTL